MPTVLRSGPYRLFFYSADRDEPRHVHVARDDCYAKFWLDPAALGSTGRFSASELRSIERIVLENRERFLEAWNEFFGS